MFDFQEKFKERNNVDLLKILLNPEAYQPKAVDAAKIIIESRQLSEEEISAAEALIKEEKQIAADKVKSKKDMENKVKSYSLSALRSINPIEAEAPSPIRIVKIISIILGGLFLLNLSFNLRMLWLSLPESPDWNIYSVLLFLSLLLTPVAIVLFFKRSRMGWIFIVGLLTYHIAISLENFIAGLIMEFTSNSYLDAIFHQPSPIGDFLVLGFYIVLLWAVCKKKVRSLYSINQQKMLSTIAIVTVLLLLSKAIT